METQLLISNLFFDEKIANMVEKRGQVFPTELLHCLHEQPTFELSESKLDNVNGNLPISVVKSFANKYEVKNGRHRICSAILKNKKDISVKILSQ